MGRKQQEKESRATPKATASETSQEDVEAHLLKEGITAGLAAAALAAPAAKGAVMPVEPGRTSAQAANVASEAWVKTRATPAANATARAKAKAKKTGSRPSLRRSGGGRSSAR
jgi:hypothetical protein